MAFDPRGFEKAMKRAVCPHFGDKPVCDACAEAEQKTPCTMVHLLRVEDIAASLGEQIRRLEQLMAVVRTMARKLGMDWQDVIDRTEKSMWAEQEREKLRGG